MSVTVLQRVAADELLARRAARGDDAAFATLYERYQRRIEAYCRSILRHEEDARDAAQNAMTKALQALRREAPRTALRPWLFRIAHNEAISLLRTRRPQVELAETLEDRDRDPADTFLVREEVAATLGGVRDLPPRAREALLLREVVDLSYDEVGNVLGVSPGAARQAVFEARTALLADRAGRHESCLSIRQELSFRDGRHRPTRKARGHLRGCGSCRAWNQAQVSRRRRLCVAPAIPAATGLLSWLGGVAGGGAGGGVKVAAALTVAATAVPIAAHDVVDRTPRTDARAKVASAAPRKVAKKKRAAVPVAKTRVVVLAAATTKPAIPVKRKLRVVATKTRGRGSDPTVTRDRGSDPTVTARRERPRRQESATRAPEHRDGPDRGSQRKRHDGHDRHRQPEAQAAQAPPQHPQERQPAQQQEGDAPAPTRGEPAVATTP